MSSEPMPETILSKRSQMTTETKPVKSAFDHLSVLPLPLFVLGTDFRVKVCTPPLCNWLHRQISADMPVETFRSAVWDFNAPFLSELLLSGASFGAICEIYPDAAWEVSAGGERYLTASRPLDPVDGGGTLRLKAVSVFNDRNRRIGVMEILERRGQDPGGELKTRHLQRFRTLFDFIPHPMAVIRLSGNAYFINQAFTNTFGWEISEVLGRPLPFIPAELIAESDDMRARLMARGGMEKQLTSRLTKDGRILMVDLAASRFDSFDGIPDGIIILYRDITAERQHAVNMDVMLGISRALFEYPDLGELLDYVSEEIKRLVGTEGALVILLDEETDELFLPGAAYESSDTRARVKDVRFAFDEIAAGSVIESGQPLIVNNTREERRHYPRRDQKLGYHTRNFIEVPLRSSDRIIGVLNGINKKNGLFTDADVELLTMISGTVSLAIENARFSDEIIKAYKKVSEFNRAKEKAVNHLSHELKTPVAALSGSLNIMKEELEQLPNKDWLPFYEMINRNLKRIAEIQSEITEIIHNRNPSAVMRLLDFLRRCIDLIEVETADITGIHGLFGLVRTRIEDLFSLQTYPSETFFPQERLEKRVDLLRPVLKRRNLNLFCRIEPMPEITMPVIYYDKVIDGLLKNAVENTPDEGTVHISAFREANTGIVEIRDTGVGIVDAMKEQIFDGFVAVQDPMLYSRKKAYEFNAGGKGTELMMIRILSERYHYDLKLDSTRCRYIPEESDTCPGVISECIYCELNEDCSGQGGTSFVLQFHPAKHPINSHP